MNLESRLKKLEQKTTDSLLKIPPYLDICIVDPDVKERKIMRVWVNGERQNEEFTPEEYEKMNSQIKGV